MVVGDDAQAIYAFRGSSVQYIWDFEKKYDNVKSIVKKIAGKTPQVWVGIKFIVDIEQEDN